MSTSNNHKTREYLQNKSKLVFSYLQKPSRWYTGLAIKKYLKRYIFKLASNNTQQNTAIATGRWSAYCHYNPAQAILNLIEKNLTGHVKNGQESKIMASGLLPQSYTEYIQNNLEKEVLLEYLPLDINTLNPNVQQLKSLALPELVIFYSSWGVTENWLELLQFYNQRAVPVILVLDGKSVFDSKFFKLLHGLKLGSVIFNLGDAFWDDQLAWATSIQSLKSKKWYASIHLEKRTSSSLEYHLTNSYEEYLVLIQAYFYILTSKLSGLAWYYVFLPWLLNMLYLNKQFKTVKQAEGVIEAGYESSLQLAVPDIVFDLQDMDNRGGLNSNIKFHTGLKLEAEDDKTHAMQQKAASLRAKILPKLKQEQEGTWQMPTLYKTENYQYLFFLSKQKNKWMQELAAEGYEIEDFENVLDEFALETQPSVKLVAEYGLKIKLF